MSAANETSTAPAAAATSALPDLLSTIGSVVEHSTLIITEVVNGLSSSASGLTGMAGLTTDAPASNSTPSSFEEFCGGPLWDSSLTWDTNQPDFTQCFQESVMVWVPCCFLWFALPLYAYCLSKMTGPKIPANWINTTKTVLGILLAFMAFLDMVKGGSDYASDGSTPIVVIISPAIMFATMIAATVLIQVERNKGFITSGILFLYWLIAFLCSLIELYSQSLYISNNGEPRDMFSFVTFVIYFILLFVQLIMSCIVDKNPVPARDPTKKPSPETTASFLSRITFNWMHSLVFTGYKKALDESDLWELHPRDLTEANGPIMEKAWNEELVACGWVENKPSFSNPNYENGYQNDVSRLSGSGGYGSVSGGGGPSDPNEGATKQQVLMNADERTPLLDAKVSVDVEVVPGGTKKEPSLLWVLTKVYGFTLLQAQLCKCVYDVLVFVGPTLQSQLINFTEDEDAELWKGFFFAVLFFLNGITQSLFFHQLFHIGMTCGMRIKSAIIAAVYKKALTMSNESRKDVTVGEIVNLMSVDAQRLQDVAGYIWMIWSAPFQITIAVYMLWGIVGPSVLAGLAVMILLIPINGVLASYQRKLQITQMSQKDQRIKLMNEVLNGMKVLKLYAWELSFKDKISAIRNMELETLKTYAYYSAFGTFTWTCAPFIVTLATFATFVLSGHGLDSNTAFVSLSLFNILRFPINLLPMMISYVVTASVSVKRIGKFLRQGEIDETNVSHDTRAVDPIIVEKGNFAWGRGADDLTVLNNVNMRIKDGSLVAVVGPVGCGKSSLISAILGEMERLSGKVNVRGSIAYVPQQAWMMNATLKDNILFGKKYRQSLYEKVLDASALRPDLEILPGGDQTEIGEKGINLSGGQKQRISLARAVYNDADVYIFDDPLSAVDSHVGKHIFEQVISNETGVLKNKTRVLVTHGLHWLPKVDQIIVLQHGNISEVGTYDELLIRNGAFAQFLKTFLMNTAEEEDSEEDEELAEVKKQLLERMDSLGDNPTAKILRQLSTGTPAVTDDSDTGLSGASGIHRRKSSVAKRKLSRAKSSTKEPEPAVGQKLIQEEKQETGDVKMAVFWSYCKALGLCNAFMVLIFFLLYQGASVLSNVWLSAWTEDPLLSNTSIPLDDPEYVSKRDLYLGVYGGLGGAQAIFVLVYAIVTAYSMVRASRAMHLSMLHNVLRSPMSFFDTTPLGRILNRFSRDMETIDNLLPQLFRSWMNTFFGVISTFLVISYSTPIFLSVILPVGLFYYFVQRFYIPTSRQLKRVESTTRSPIYSHFSETITGASTIRAYREQARFVGKSDDLVDHNLVFYFASIASNRWLGVRLELIGSLVVFCAAVFAVLGRNTLSGGLVGLSISYALQVTQSLNWMVRMTSDLESNVVSVERVQEYSETPTESPWYIDETKPSRGWPQQGNVAFENYAVRYREGLDLVLRGITINVSAGEKIGIVGRTGAGKSSLTLSLFRLIEAASGQILIDGVDVANLGLHQLRGNLTILPQDPVLFSGTLRMNLDPFGVYRDSAIWVSLENAHLKEFVDSLPAGLDYECGEGGINLSVGQRQLICLARTLLRKTKILILDEATAAVDLETDELIQTTIRKEFAECTILTIAHRLNTIMDNDKVLVLDAGKISEFDSPTNLLKDRKSVFYGMAKDAGLV